MRGGRRFARRFLPLLVGAALLGSGCATAGGARSASAPAGASPPSAPASPSPAVHYVGHLSLDPPRGAAGAAVTVRGADLPPDAAVQILWRTARGAWVLGGSAHEVFQGRRFTPVSLPLARATTDSRGGLTAAFRVPGGFGFEHDVVVMRGATEINQAGFEVAPTLSVSPRSGPVGTPVTVTLAGVGYQMYHNSWMLVYDDRFTGWLSSVTTGGTAVAVVPATGIAGIHVLRAINGHDTFPYLNAQQSTAGNPILQATFTVTPGPAVLPPPAGAQGLAAVPGAAPAGTAPALWVGPERAPVGSLAVLRGRGVPPGREVRLSWGSVVGNRLDARGWRDASRSLGSVRADARGEFRFAFQVPDDLGGRHAIVADAVGAPDPLTTAMTVTPSAFALSPAAGPAGAMITVHLKGGGWTDTANIYTVDYDNGYVGYACAFNSQGDIDFRLPAAGAPGWHFIDLYPAIYAGTDAPQVDDFRVPQLTYARDHPGERLPAFHFAFRVTG